MGSDWRMDTFAPWPSILVHLDASPRAALRLALAQSLAAAHGGEVTAIYAVLPAALASPWASAEGMGAALPLLEDVDRVQRDRARAIFEQAASRGRLAWREVLYATEPRGLLDAALYADLLLLGQPDPGDTLVGTLPADLVPGLVVDSGKPALVIPRVGSPLPPGHRVLVAWKPARESARAVVAALPWMRRADAVHLACQLPVPEQTQAALSSLEAWLRRQGVVAPVRHHVLGAEHVGEMLLSLAADTGADLTVMGCYGHSRAREFVLGGVTRTWLEAMTVPVLMAH